MLYHPFLSRSRKTEFPFFFEPLEPRVQLSGELSGPQAVAFGTSIPVGDTNQLDTQMNVTITNTSGVAVEVGTPYVPNNSGISVNLAGFPSGQELLSEESATFAVDLNTSTDVTVNTTVTVPYNDGQAEYLNIPVTGIVGNGSPPDTTPPTAKIAYAKALRVVAKYYYFAVEYTDDTAVDVSTITADNILVTRKHYPTLHANLISISPDSDSANVTVVYAARYGPHGTWTSAYDGLWNLSLGEDQVADTSGNFADSVSFGPFAILIPAAKAAVVKAQPAVIVLPTISLFSTTPLNQQDAVWDDM